jgi:hypothetical protein
MKVRVEVRERRARQSKAQARTAFAKSMQAAEEYAMDLMRGQPKLPEGEPSGGPPALGLKFQEWGEAYYKYLKDGTALSKAHVELRDRWNEIKATAATCAKAREARAKAAEARSTKTAAEISASQEFAQKMEAAAAVARAAKENKYSKAAVAAGETAYSTNAQAFHALEDKFFAYAVNKYHSLMWPESHKLSAASVEMEARWAEEMEDA